MNNFFSHGEIMDKRKAGRKPEKKTITMDVDRELYEFFKMFADHERDTMAGILRKHILALMRQQDAAKMSDADA